MSNPLTSHKISRRTLFKVGGGLAAAAVATRMNLALPATAAKAAAATVIKKGRITPADRKAAAMRARKYKNQGLIPQAAPRMAPWAMPDYFSATIPNWHNSPMPVVDASGNVLSGGIHKFVDALPGLGPTAANLLGQYLPVAVPDTTTYPDADYYEIEAVQFTEQMHTDLLPTTLRGYHQTNMGAPNPPHYMGPVILAHRNRPVRIKFTNNLPGDGNLFIPVDTTVMGAGAGPQMYISAVNMTAGGSGYRTPPTVGFTGGGGANAAATATILNGAVTGVTITNAGMGYTSAPTVTFTPTNGGSGAAATAVVFAGGNYTDNRLATHLHGGDTIWISDGTPHQWITPATQATPYPKGVSVQNVPDMPDPGPGSQTLFYSNEQSARLMFYHDHAYGITRLHVYSGLAAGYLVDDPVEQTLINGGTITSPYATTVVAAGTVPATQIPLIIQDRTFIDTTTIAAQDPTWGMTLDATKSNLWFPHVYMPNQNPYDMSGANAMGRWDYGPWFWPPFTGMIHQPVPNPLYLTTPLEGPVNPGTPNPSLCPEAFVDTPIVNGTAYPYLQVTQQAYRFRILNACNDRYLNLSLFYADPTLVNTPLLGLSLTNPGQGYTANPTVTISAPTGTPPAPAVAVQATAGATYDPLTGMIATIFLTNPGAGYIAPPTVTISAPLGTNPIQATAFAVTAGIGLGKEVKMVPAVPGTGLPPLWPTDGRDGGVPDPTTVGPDWIQIGTEGGILPQPAIIHPCPVGYDYNRRSITVLNVLNKALYLGPAERADVIVDFSAVPAGSNIILYNDAPVPMPAFDPRFDYYTADPDQTGTGGAPTTMPGYGPNTRTIMQIQVGAGPAVPFNLAALQAALPAAFAASQPAPIIPQARYAAAYPTLATTTTFPTDAFVRIQDTSHTFIPFGGTTPITWQLLPKAIQELFEVNYGRMNAILGTELPFTNMITQTTIPLGYIDPATEQFAPSNVATLVGSAGDGTQIWKITHNGVDTHSIHVHLFNAQVINRVGWDGAVKPPDDNEIGWKETIRMNPLEDIIIAIRPFMQNYIPFAVPNSVRLLDPTMPLGSTGQFSNVDPMTNNPVVTTNQMVNYGWEYVWHCHLLGHEENDMMRPMQFAVPPAAPTNLVAVGFNAPLRVVLTWTPPANAASLSNYVITRANDAGFLTGVTTFTVPVGTNTYTDQAVVANTPYFYQVIAVNMVGGVVQGGPAFTANSAPSNTVLVSAPAAPTSLAFTQSARNAPVVLTWIDNAPSVPNPPNFNAERNFTVQRATSLTGTWTTLSTTVPPVPGTGGTGTYSDSKVLPARQYYYRVFATNFFGASGFSNTLPVLTL